MKKVCTVGSATQDIFLEYEGAATLHIHEKLKDKKFLLLEQGTKIDIPQLHYASGGGATNAAVSFKKMGHSVEAFFKLGEDHAGAFVINEMQAYDVGIAHAVVDSNEQTALSFIIPSQEKNHVVLCYRAANKKLSLSDFPLEKIEDFDLLYISSLARQTGPLFPTLIREAHKKQIPILVNPGPAQFTTPEHHFFECLPLISILLINTFEAIKLFKAFLEKQDSALGKLRNQTASTKIKNQREETQSAFINFKKENYQNGNHKDNPVQIPQLQKQLYSDAETTFTIVDFFKHVRANEQQIIIVTNGSEGVYVASGTYWYFFPSISTNVISALGAGDAFGSAFASALLYEKTIEEATVWGALNATSVISNKDAKMGLLTRANIEHKTRTLISRLKRSALPER